MEINTDIFCSLKSGLRVVDGRVALAQSKDPLTPESVANNWKRKGISSLLHNNLGFPKKDLELWGAVEKDRGKFEGNTSWAEVNRDEISRRLRLPSTQGEALDDSDQVIASPDAWFYVKVWTDSSKSSVTSTFPEFVRIMETLRQYPCLNDELLAEKQHSRRVAKVEELAVNIEHDGTESSKLRSDVPLPQDWADKVVRHFDDMGDTIEADGGSIDYDAFWEVLESLGLADPAQLFDQRSDRYSEEEKKEIELCIQDIERAENQLSTLKTSYVPLYDKYGEDLKTAIRVMRADLGRLAYRERTAPADVPGQMELMTPEELRRDKRKTLREKRLRMNKMIEEIVQNMKPDSDDNLFDEGFSFASSNKVLRI